VSDDLSRYEPVDVDAQFLGESEHPHLPAKQTSWLKICLLVPLSLVLAPMWLMFWLAKQAMLREHADTDALAPRQSR
jgi:hypothetical protein